MFAGVYKVTKLSPEKVFCMSVPSPTGVDYTDAISMRFEGGATGAFSGSAFVPKGYGGASSLIAMAQARNQCLDCIVLTGQQMIFKVVIKRTIQLHALYRKKILQSSASGLFPL